MESNQSTEIPVIFSEDCEIQFSLFFREHKYEETEITRTYGITAVFMDFGGNRFEKIISDISSVRENVENIIKRLIENKVSFYHLEAVIEDILTEEAII